MRNLKLYQYAIFYTPTEEEVKDKKVGPTIITDVKSIVASDEKEVTIRVAREIPEEYLDRLENVVIAIRPF